MPASLRDDGVEGGGELAQVAFARDRVEGEMIRGLLENAGIPSLLEQAGLSVDGPRLGFGLATRGFGGGPQRVMVHANRADEARALLAETLVDDGGGAIPEAVDQREDAGAGRARNYGVVGAYARAASWSFVALVVAFGAFLLFRTV